MTTVSGIELLEIAPNLDDLRESQIARAHERMETDQLVALTPTWDSPAGTTHTMRWLARSRADLAALVAFLDARLGQVVPCWIPTFQRDATVLTSSVTGWKVAKGTGMHALGAHVAVRPHWQWWISRTAGGATFRIWHLTSVTDNGDGTETWNGSTPTGAAPAALTSAQGGVFSRLVLARMVTDGYRTTYLNGQVSIVSADFVEIGAEAP